MKEEPVKADQASNIQHKAPLEVIEESQRDSKQTATVAETVAEGLNTTTMLFNGQEFKTPIKPPTTG